MRQIQAGLSGCAESRKVFTFVEKKHRKPTMSSIGKPTPVHTIIEVGLNQADVASPETAYSSPTEMSNGKEDVKLLHGANWKYSRRET